MLASSAASLNFSLPLLCCQGSLRNVSCSASKARLFISVLTISCNAKSLGVSKYILQELALFLQSQICVLSR